MPNLRCQVPKSAHSAPQVRVGLLTVVLVAALAGTAHAAAPDAHGYWWRLPLGAASPAPDGGLWVAADPTGPQAVSALRFRAPEGEEPASLVLDVDGSDGMTPAIVACPAASAWEPADGAGAWDDAPEADCEAGQADGVPDEEAGTWTFPLGALAVDRAVDVVLVPAEGSGTFSVTFAPPDDGTVVTSDATATGGGADGGVEPALDVPAGRPAATPSEDAAVPAATAPFTPPPLGAGAEPFDADPPAAAPPPRQPVPANAAGDASRSDGGSREPLALVAALLIGGAWVARTRFAVAAAEAHPLAAPFAGGGGSDGSGGTDGTGPARRLSGAGSLLAGDLTAPEEVKA